MLDKLLQFLNPTPPAEPLPEEEGRVALAALLVHAARADGDYAPEEVRRIDRILATRFGLSPFEAARLRVEGEAAEANAVDLHRFSQAIKRAVPHEERLAVIEAVWQIAYADGAEAAEEAGLVRRLCGLLGIADRDAGLARSRIRSGD